MLAIVIFALSVTICEITTFNLRLDNLVSIRILDIKKVGQFNTQQCRQIRGWMTFFVAYKMVKK